MQQGQATLGPPASPTGRDEKQDADLLEFIRSHSRLFVLTGAGVSTDSGIPDYRDDSGAWKRARPMMFQEFVGSAQARKRYWARSLVGWQTLARARPGSAHCALARMQSSGYLRALVSQNVDGLHQRAGSRAVIDLHGRIDRVRCLQCGTRSRRDLLQHRLHRLNPGWANLAGATAPDGDADLRDRDFSDFNLADCEQCGGLLKPDVVFFGESVPQRRVRRAYAALEKCDAMLVVGSSLMVFSGFRFARAAAQAGKPLALLNQGVTRADALAGLRVQRPCGEVLARMAARLDPV